MNRRHFLFLAAASAMAALPARAAEPPVLRIGVAPHTSARLILEMYQPLRESLQQSLGGPVEILTAPDFTEFARRALAQEYDIAITTGHQARLLQTDGGYRPLVTYSAEFHSVILAPKDSIAKVATDFNGATVIGLSRTSLVTLWGEQWLRAGQAQNLQMRYVSAADSVAQLLLSGDAAAGLVSLANFQSLSPEVRAGLRFVVQSGAQLGRVYMLNSRQASREEAIQKALAAFAGSPAGSHYFESYQLEGYRAVKADELVAMDPFAQAVRKELGATEK